MQFNRVINGKTGSLTGGVETYMAFGGADEAYEFWYNVKNDKAEIYIQEIRRMSDSVAYWRISGD